MLAAGGRLRAGAGGAPSVSRGLGSVAGAAWVELSTAPVGGQEAAPRRGEPASRKKNRRQQKEITRSLFTQRVSVPQPTGSVVEG